MYKTLVLPLIVQFSKSDKIKCRDSTELCTEFKQFLTCNSSFIQAINCAKTCGTCDRFDQQFSQRITPEVYQKYLIVDLQDDDPWESSGEGRDEEVVFYDNFNLTDYRDYGYDTWVVLR